MAQAKPKKPTFDWESKEGQEYWLSKLSEWAGVSNIKLDYERPPSYTGGKGRVDISLPEDVTRAAARLTGNSPFLLYTTLMAALKICLHKYTGQRSVVVGSPARRREGEEPPAANALPVLDDIEDGMSFRDLLVKVRETLAEAYARQTYPYERLVRDLGLEAVQHKCPLFDVALALKNIHQEMPDVKNDLTLTFDSAQGLVAGVAEYNRDLFRRESVERFVGHFINLLSAAVADVRARVSDLEMLTAAERQRILFGWNETAAEYARGRCIHHLFEEQAARTPDAVALVSQDERLTYRELNRRANRLAAHLRRKGVAPEVLVGICMERSPEMIVALLGVLKAGGAYVPLDPDYPKERLAFMLEDSRAPVLLTQQRLVERLPPYGGAVVRLDADRDELAQFDGDENFAAGVTADNLAYVIYTSGSTGRPKGVMVGHRGVCNLAEAQARAFDVRPESRVVQFAPFSFDASVSEIFMALIKGAALYLVPRETMYLGAEFVRFLHEQAITTATFPPAVLSLLDPQEVPDLKTVIAAGESCPPEVAARWSPGRRFFNAYGPTETTVCATLTECAQNGHEPPPIGRPLANAQVYLLDSALRPVPAGVPGELFIGGIGLARGYLGRPGLTAERFIPHPYQLQPGERLYRSGDLARYRPDAQIEFLGRLDEQVKIRGFRVEPGEIESAIAQYPGVRECAVAPHEDARGERRLAAYFVAEPGRAVSGGDLQNFLRQKLPPYMMPSAFVALDALPLTPNGKIDRRALPVPGVPEAGREKEFVAPRTPIEKKLAEIWAELLGITQVDVNDNFMVSIHDHFFDLGGHSLLAVRMFSRIREAFGVELPLNLIFTSAPTISGLAGAIEQYMLETADAEELASMLKELDELSDDEINALLESEGQLTQEPTAEGREPR